MIQQINEGSIKVCQKCLKKNKNQEEIFKLPNCLHQFCKNCLTEQFSEKIKNDSIRIEDFNCYFCKGPFNPKLAQQFLTQDLYMRYRNIIQNVYQPKDGYIQMICLNRQCRRSYNMDDHSLTYKCLHCYNQYCRKCNLEVHDFQTCEQKQAEHQQRESFNMKKVLKLQRCPVCENLCKRKDSFFITCKCGVNFCFICDQQLLEQEQFLHYENNDPFQSKCKLKQNQQFEIEQTNCQFCNSQTYRAFKDKITICTTNNCLQKALCSYCQSTVDPKDLGSHFDLVEVRCFKQIQDEIFSQNGTQEQLAEYLHSIDVKQVQDQDQEYEIKYILALGFANNFKIIINYKSQITKLEFDPNIVESNSPITSIQFCVGAERFSDKQTLYLGEQNGRVRVVQFNLQELNESSLIREITSFKNKITSIKTFIYNNKEYFLASSYDSTIQLFKITRAIYVDVKHVQTLEGSPEEQILKGHKDPVFWLTLSQNKNESLYMASSGKDEFILIWKWNDKQEKWDVFSKFQKKQFGNRIAFFDSDTIIWQIYKKPIFRVFKHHHAKNQKMIEYDQLMIKDYNQENWQNELDDFPLIQNEQNNFIVAKFTDKIYIIKKNLNYQGILQIQPTLIQCEQYCNLGAVTQDGKYLYLFSYKNKTLIKYKLFQN